MDSLRSILKQRAQFWLAALVLLFGFVAMNIFALLTPQDPNLPGLYYYRSATWGDGVMLPALTYFLMRVNLHHTLTTREKAFVSLFAAIGATAGSFTQWSWLASTETRLNWTIPQLHTFNAAGWYHAGFLITMCGLLAGLGAWAWFGLRHSVSTGTTTQSGSVIGIALAGTGFAALLGLDNATDSSLGAVATLPALAATILAAAWFALKSTHRIRTTVSLLILCLSWATSIQLAALGSEATNASTVVLSAGIFLAGCGVTINRSGAARNQLVLTSIVGVTMALPAIRATEGTLNLRVLVAALVLGVISWCALNSFVSPSARLPSLSWAIPVTSLTAVGAGSLLLTSADRTSTEGILQVGTLAMATSILLLSPWVYARFKPVLLLEQGVAQGDLRSAKATAYREIGCVSGYAFAVILLFLDGSLPERLSASGLGTQWESVTMFTAGLLIILMILAKARRRPLVANLVLGLWAGFQAFAILSLPWHDSLKSLPAAAWAASASVLTAVLVALFIYEGVSANLGPLQVVRLRPQSIATAVLTALCVGISCLWAVVVTSLSTNTDEWTLTTACALLATILALLLIPYSGARACPEAYPDRQYTLGQPLDGVLQDSFMAVLLFIFTGWIPFMLAQFQPDLLLWSATVFGYLSLAAPFYIFIILNNTTHVRNEQTRIQKLTVTATAQEKSRLLQFKTSLARHCWRQNVIAAIAVVPVLVQALIAVAGTLASPGKPIGMRDYLQDALFRP